MTDWRDKYVRIIMVLVPAVLFTCIALYFVDGLLAASGGDSHLPPLNPIRVSPSRSQSAPTPSEQQPSIPPSEQQPSSPSPGRQEDPEVAVERADGTYLYFSTFEEALNGAPELFRDTTGLHLLRDIYRSSDLALPSGIFLHIMLDGHNMTIEGDLAYSTNYCLIRGPGTFSVGSITVHNASLSVTDGAVVDVRGDVVRTSEGHAGHAISCYGEGSVTRVEGDVVSDCSGIDIFSDGSVEVMGSINAVSEEAARVRSGSRLTVHGDVRITSGIGVAVEEGGVAVVHGEIIAPVTVSNDGTGTINGNTEAADYECVILGGEQYRSLQDALAAASDGDTIVLGKGIDVSDDIIIDDGRTLTIDINRNSMYMFNAGIFVSGHSSQLNLVDSSNRTERVWVLECRSLQAVDGGSINVGFDYMNFGSCLIRSSSGGSISFSGFIELGMKDSSMLAESGGKIKIGGYLCFGSGGYEADPYAERAVSCFGSGSEVVIGGPLLSNSPTAIFVDSRYQTAADEMAAGEGGVARSGELPGPRVIVGGYIANELVPPRMVIDGVAYQGQMPDSVIAQYGGEDYLVYSTEGSGGASIWQRTEGSADGDSVADGGDSPGWGDSQGWSDSPGSEPGDYPGAPAITEPTIVWNLREFFKENGSWAIPSAVVVVCLVAIVRASIRSRKSEVFDMTGGSSAGGTYIPKDSDH